MSVAAGLERVIDLALAEDVGEGDITTDAIVAEGLTGTAEVVLREPGVICGVEAALAVMCRLDAAATMEVLEADGTRVDATPCTVARIHGSMRALLTGERLALNLLQRMSGIATATRAYADAVDGTGVAVLDTRKTAPGLRGFDRHAVACGGGTNHRSGLHDAVLIKDNHVAVAGGVGQAVRAVRAAQPEMPVEVEVDTLEQL